MQRALDISNDFTSLQAEANETANLHTITQPQTIISSHTAPVLAADWVDGSSILISSVALDNSLIFWDPEQNSLVANVSPGIFFLFFHNPIYLTSFFSARGKSQFYEYYFWSCESVCHFLYRRNCQDLGPQNFKIAHCLHFVS